MVIPKLPPQKVIIIVFGKLYPKAIEDAGANKNLTLLSKNKPNISKIPPKINN